MPKRIHIANAMPLTAIGKISESDGRFPFDFSASVEADINDRPLS